MSDPDETPPPMKSPDLRYDYDQGAENEPKSGSYLINATMHDVKEAKKNVEAVVEAHVAQQVKYIFSADVKWFVGSIVGSVIAVVFALGWMSAQAQSKVDAGVEPLKTEIKENKKAAELVQLANEARFSRLEAGMQRQDLKADAILMGLHLNNPAPTPRDGGSP